MMMTTWDLPQPSLIISVTGHESDFHVNKLLYDSVRSSLRAAAIGAGAWILTSGTNSGVAKLVGKVLNTTIQPVVIGIVATDYIQNMNSSTEDSSEGSISLNNIELEDGYLSFECLELLNPNHSHFIIVKDAKQRAELAKNISKINDKDEIPIIQIVIGGGNETLETVCHALQNDIPTVVVKGSKGIAFILAYSYLNSHGREKSKMRYTEASLEEIVREMLRLEFLSDSKNSSDDTTERLDRIKQCLEMSDHIYVCDLENKDEMDATILRALLKDNKYDVMEMLKLTMAFNRIDEAKSYIFTDENSKKIGCLDEVMLAAIQLNLFDFVKLFLDNGVILKMFLTKQRLLQLYIMIPPTSLLYSLLKTKKNNKTQNKRKNDFTLEDVRMVIQKLMGDAFELKCITDAKEADEKALNDQNDGKNKKVRQDFKNPSFELFIWSILMVKQEMAKIFWIHGKDALPKALVGYTLLKRLGSKTDNANTELFNKIQQCLNEWSETAVGLLSVCHAMSEQKTQDLLVRETSYGFNTSCCLIAMNSDNKEFLSQKACQTLLNNIWYGRLAHENSFLKLLSCMFCPFLAIRVLTFTIHKNTFSKVEHMNVHKKAEDVEAKPDEQFQKSSEIQKYKQNTNERMASMRSNTFEEMKTDKQQITPRKKLYYFFTAPVIICMYNVLTYVVFLSMFAFVLIFNFESSVSPPDIALVVYVFSIFTEELRQVGRTSTSGLTSKLYLYISDVWNKVDILTIVLFITGMTVRFLPYGDAIEAARVILAVNFITFCMRLLHIFSVHQKLGPKLVMIRKMFEDLIYFILILMVFVVAYAIASHSILYPNSPFTWKTVIHVLRRSYWNIYGELFIDEIEGGQECTFDKMLWGNGTYQRCPSDVGKIVVPILMGGYMLVASVLLLNLLIAMFNYTFEKVHAEANKHWCFQRYSLISEYYTRPVLCPPLNLVNHLFLLVRYVFARCFKGNNDQTRYSNLNRKLKNMEIERTLIKWETARANDYQRQVEIKALESLDCKVDSSNEILSRIEEKLQKLQSAHLEMKQEMDELRKAQHGLANSIKPMCNQEEITGDGRCVSVPRPSDRADISGTTQQVHL